MTQVPDAGTMAPLLTLEDRPHTAGATVVSVRGELDIATAGHLVDLLRDRLLGRGAQVVVVDLSRLTFCDCAG